MEERLVYRLIIALCIIAPLAGCSMSDSRMKDVLAPIFYKKPTAKQEEENRQAFQKNRDPKNLYWLMANRIDAGMTVNEVGGVIGEQGIRLNNDSWVKTRDGNYQATDEVWQWRASNDGKAIHLVFRKGKLVNYNPAEFHEEEWD
jgi:hypothetical protein